MNAIKGKWTKCFFKRQISREDISLAYEKKKKKISLTDNQEIQSQKCSHFIPFSWQR